MNEHKHFTMIRDFHVADLFTIANGFCGIGSIFLAIQSISTKQSLYIYFAAGLIPLAIVFDFFDGRVARWRHTASSMGREMDSLADVISFGVSPAVISFALGLNTILDSIILMFFAVCGLSRLARYNVTADKLSEGTNKVKYYEGTPITFSIIPLGITLILSITGHLMLIPAGFFSFHFVSILYIISGCLMISKTIRIPKP